METYDKEKILKATRGLKKIPYFERGNIMIDLTVTF